jgi:hypothetical protein
MQAHLIVHKYVTHSNTNLIIDESTNDPVVNHVTCRYQSIFTNKCSHEVSLIVVCYKCR